MIAPCDLVSWLWT